MSSIYDQIGGLPALEVAVERFSERVSTDPQLASLFVGMDFYRLKSHLITYLAQVVDGPQHYTGAALCRAHAHLPIEQQHFDAVAHHLSGTLREIGVHDVLIAAVMKRVWPLASHIVNTPSRRVATVAVA